MFCAKTTWFKLCVEILVYDFLLIGLEIGGGTSLVALSVVVDVWRGRRPEFACDDQSESIVRTGEETEGGGDEGIEELGEVEREEEPSILHRVDFV